MNYLIAYLAIGTMIYLSGHVFGYLSGNGADSSAARMQGVFEELQRIAAAEGACAPESPGLATRLQASAVGRLLLVLSFVCVAPALLSVLLLAMPIVYLIDRLQARKTARQVTDAHLEEAAPFKVRRRHLIEAHTIAEIESLERVDDPLRAQPLPPFGFLHAQWMAFLRRTPPGATIWSFSVTDESTSGWTEEIRGYVAVRVGLIGEHFIVERRTRKTARGR